MKAANYILHFGVYFFVVLFSKLQIGFCLIIITLPDADIGHMHQCRNMIINRTQRILRGYYEFLMGGVCLQKQDFEDAEKHYEIAAQYPLRSVNDHVAALVHVANISIRQGNFDKAEAYLQLTEKHKEKINAKMKDVINRLYQELKKHKP